MYRQIIHSRPVCRLTAAVLGPRLCGKWVGKQLRPYVVTDRINVLTIGRELFFKDIEQIKNRTDINFIRWRSGHLGRLQQGWVPKVCQKQGHFFPETHYRTHSGWDKGEALMRGIHQTLEQTGQVPVIMSANLDYWQEEAVRRYCTRTNAQHLVLCRENIIIPYYRDLVIRRHRQYNFRFGGHVAVFSQSMKQVFIDSGACAPEQITVTGAPRMDIWQDERPPVEKDTVLLLSFRTSLFPEMFDKTLRLFIASARQHTNLNFIIKCKEGRDDAWARQVLRKTDAPSNLSIAHRVELRTLLERSRVIIGLNTLALAEALLTDAVVLIPAWMDRVRYLDQLMMDPQDPELQSEIHFCSDLNDLQLQITQSLSAKRSADPHLRLRLMNRYMHYAPGETASCRVALQIKSLSNLSRKSLREEVCEG
jgi:hypothetical protein